MRNISSPQEIFARYEHTPSASMRKGKRIAIELLGQEVKNTKVELRIDFFEKYTNLTKEHLTTRQQLTFFCYLIAVATVYKYCMYSDLLSYGHVQERLLTILNIPYRHENNRIVSRNGLFDQLGLTETIHFRDTPVLQCYKEFYRGESSDIFAYVKDYKYLVDTMPPTKKQVFKKPLFCMKRRVTNKQHLLGSFYDNRYTFKVKLSNILYMIHDLELSADVVGFYYYVLLEYTKTGRLTFRFSHKVISKYFDVDYRTINKYLALLEEHGYLRVLQHGRTGTDRIIQIMKVEG